MFCWQNIPEMCDNLATSLLIITPPATEVISILAFVFLSLQSDNFIVFHSVCISGCAVYTGPDTKVSINSRHANHKFSKVEKSDTLQFFLPHSLVSCQCKFVWQSKKLFISYSESTFKHFVLSANYE